MAEGEECNRGRCDGGKGGEKCTRGRKAWAGVQNVMESDRSAEDVMESVRDA